MHSALERHNHLSNMICACVYTMQRPSLTSKCNCVHPKHHCEATWLTTFCNVL